MLDTIHRIETPEGVDLDLRVAGPAVRSVAWLIDFLIRFLAAVVVLMPLGLLGQVGGGMFLIILFALEWCYAVLFEVVYRGAPPGKRMMGILVVNADGTPVGFAASMLRNLLRAADFLPLLYGVGLVAMIGSRSFQRLGDLAAGTLVIYRDDASRLVFLPDAAPLPPPLPLELSEQRSVLGFAQRSGQLSLERVKELAAIAEPLAASSPVAFDDRVRYLHGVAAWLSGRRTSAAKDTAE